MPLKMLEHLDPKLITFRPGESRLDPAAAVGKVCVIYTTAAPVLKLIGKVPILPAKWKATIVKFCDLLDLLCAGSNVS
jgi:hypothetical protein